MKIGAFGNIVFETSRERIRTFDQFKRLSKARFGIHPRLQQKPALEFIGPDLDEISFQMIFSKQLGINPLKEIEKVQDILKSGKEHNLVIGNKNFGKFVIMDIDEDWNKFDRQSNLLIATISIKLKEYA